MERKSRVTPGAGVRAAITPMTRRLTRGGKSRNRLSVASRRILQDA
ncbi:hypothetical protein ACWGDT_27370 [Streptomyces avermitilis]